MKHMNEMRRLSGIPPLKYAPVTNSGLDACEGCIADFSPHPFCLNLRSPSFLPLVECIKQCSVRLFYPSQREASTGLC